MAAERLDRTLEILQVIPRAPTQASTQQIYMALKHQGETFSKRTLERYLAALEYKGLLQLQIEGRMHLWQRKDKHFLFGELLSPEIALAYVLAEPALIASAPKELLSQFKPRISQARKVLEQSTLGDWKQRVIYTADSFPPRSMPQQTTITDLLYQAVLLQYTVNVVYQRTGHTEKLLLLHPYGILHAAFFKLVVTIDRFKRPVFLPF